MPRPPLIRQGAGPDHAYEQARRHRQARLAHRSAPEPPDTPNLNHVLSRLGDEQQLRGIPAIARGVQGAIPGTNPALTLHR